MQSPDLTEPVANAQQPDEETDLPSPVLKIRSFHEALESLEDVRNSVRRESVVFLRSHAAANTLIDSVAQLVCSLLSVTSLVT